LVASRVRRFNKTEKTTLCRLALYFRRLFVLKENQGRDWSVRCAFSKKHEKAGKTVRSVWKPLKTAVVRFAGFCQVFEINCGFDKTPAFLLR
jgi:hypothetical protein